MTARHHRDARPPGTRVMRVASVPDEAGRGTRHRARGRPDETSRRSSTLIFAGEPKATTVPGYGNEGRIRPRRAENIDRERTSPRARRTEEAPDWHSELRREMERSRPGGPAGHWPGTDSTRLAGNLPIRGRPRRVRPILSAPRSRPYNGSGCPVSRGIERSPDDRSWTGGIATLGDDGQQGGARWISSKTCSTHPTSPGAGTAACGPRPRAGCTSSRTWASGRRTWP